VSTAINFSSFVKDTTLAGTTLTIPISLSNSTPYYWHVRAQNIGGASAYSSPTWTFMTIIAAPAAPTIILPASGATNQSINPTLSWSKVNGAATYDVQVSTSSDFTSVPDNILTDTFVTIGPLSNTTPYYWRVLAKNNGGSSAWATSSFTADVIPPTVISTNPVRDSTGVALDASITATFSEAMSQGTINTTNFTLVVYGSTSLISGTVSYDLGTNTATFLPSASLASSTQYTATIASAVSDVAGNAMGGDHTWSFTTTP